MFFPLRCSDMIDRGHYDQRTLNSRRENQGEWVTVSCVNHWQSQMEREREERVMKDRFKFEGRPFEL